MGDRFRRISPVAVRPGEGPLTDSIAGAQPSWEGVLMPITDLCYLSVVGQGRSGLSLERLEQRLCVFEIGRAETLGEPAANRREQAVRFGMAVLVAAKPG